MSPQGENLASSSLPSDHKKRGLDTLPALTDTTGGNNAGTRNTRRVGEGRARLPADHIRPLDK
jgi:hypothetical protein